MADLFIYILQFGDICGRVLQVSLTNFYSFELLRLHHSLRLVLGSSFEIYLIMLSRIFFALKS